MAIVSHYAMRRYPIGPLEQQPTGGSSDFYTASNQKVKYYKILYQNRMKSY